MATRRQNSPETDIRVFPNERVGAGFDASLPMVSVVIPLFNQAAFVREAIESVLEQDYPCLEIHVIDDGSSDVSASIVSEMSGQIALHTQENRGPSAARNVGLSKSGGEVVAFLDADDRWPRDKVRNQIVPLLDEKDIDVTLGRIRKLTQTKDEPEFSLSSESCYGVQLGSALFRRSVFDTVGLFDETLSHSEDHDWFFKAREQGVNMVRIENDGLHYRVHSGGVSRKQSAAQVGYGLPAILKRSLDRRRATTGGQAVSMGFFADLPCWKSSK